MSQTDRTLYYFPGSFYSLRAVLALYEKELTFKDYHVNIMAGEQLKDSYLKVNPKGLVPVLKDGDKFIAESEDIIDYLDKTYKTGTTLVPDESTPLGQKVRQQREFLNAVKVDIVTYGVLLNRQFSVKGLQFSGPIDMIFNRKDIANKFNSAIKTIDAKLATETDQVLREALQKKKAFNTLFRDTIQDTDKVALVLDGLEPVFDKLETLLETSRKEVDGNSDYWLCGATFTTADISAANLFFRLYQVGVDERYYSATKRRIVHAYSVRLLKRPTVVKMIATADTTFAYIVRGKLKTAAVVSIKILLVTGLLGLGAYGAWTYCNKMQALSL